MLNIIAIASCMGLSNVAIAVGSYIRSYVHIYVTEPGIRNTASAHNVVEDRSDQTYTKANM